MDSAYVQICYEVNQPAYFQMHDFQIGPGTGRESDQFPSQVQFRSEETRSRIYESCSVDINDIEINIEQWKKIKILICYIVLKCPVYLRGHCGRVVKALDC